MKPISNVKYWVGNGFKGMNSTNNKNIIIIIYISFTDITLSFSFQCLSVRIWKRKESVMKEK